MEGMKGLDFAVLHHVQIELLFLQDNRHTLPNTHLETKYHHRSVLSEHMIALSDWQYSSNAWTKFSA